MGPVQALNTLCTETLMTAYVKTLGKKEKKRRREESSNKFFDVWDC